MHSYLLQHIRQYVQLTAAEEQTIISLVQCHQFRKKDFLLKQGQICKANYFVVKGCLRSFFTTENNTEQIVQFALEHWWLTDYMSLNLQQPSVFNIQAIETAEVISIDKAIEQELFDKVPALEHYFRMVLQKAQAASQMRIRYIYGFSAKERYFHFIQSFPAFAQRVPQYMVASYLGFSPEVLSKIRAKKL
jgi:CRP-like cAMP-binding protein